MTRPMALLALLIIVASGIYAKGRVDGKAALQAQYDALEDAFREAITAAESRRLAAAAERDELQRQLEDLANADPVSVPDALPAGRVRRLDEIQ